MSRTFFLQNPRSKKYAHAYAWMTPAQRAHAYLIYQQRLLLHVQDKYSAAVEANAKQSELNRLYRNLVKVEERVMRLERAEQQRDYRDFQRHMRRDFHPD